MTSKKNLSLCMITKNDEKYISCCLQDLKDIVDEIVIVDIGSSDQTIELAEQSGANVYQMEWRNNYGEVKNFCLDQAKGRWILFLQPNETISSEQQKELIHLLDNPNAEGYLLFVNHSSESNYISSPVQWLRLFRNRREYRYQYKAFEQIPDQVISNIEEPGIQIVQRADSSPAFEIQLAIQLLEEELIENPNNCYLQYMYGIVLLNRQKFEEAILYFQDALLSVNFGYLFAPHLFKCLSWSYIYLQRHNEALDVLYEGIKLYPSYTDFLVLRGEVRKQLKQYREALRDLEGSIKRRGQPNSMVPAPEIDTPIIYQLLGEVHEQLLNYMQALSCYKQSYESDKTNEELLKEIEKLTEKSNSEVVLEDLLKVAIEQISSNEKQSGFFQKTIEQLLYNEHVKLARKLVEPWNSQPLGALSYVLWSKVFIKELEEWMAKIYIKIKSTLPTAPLAISTQEKPGKALMVFYRRLCISGKNIDEFTLRDATGEMTCTEVHEKIGDFYAKSQKKMEATSAYLRALQWYPHNETVQEKLNILYHENPSLIHTFIEGNEWIMEGGQFHQKQYFSQYVLGLIHFINHQFEQALSSFSQFAENDAFYPIVLPYIASSLWLTGKESEAESRLLIQNNIIEFLSLFYRICKSYALFRLNEGLQKYRCSELIIKEQENIHNSSYNKFI